MCVCACAEASERENLGAVKQRSGRVVLKKNGGGEENINEGEKKVKSMRTINTGSSSLTLSAQQKKKNNNIVELILKSGQYFLFSFRTDAPKKSPNPSPSPQH